MCGQLFSRNHSFTEIRKNPETMRHTRLHLALATSLTLLVFAVTARAQAASVPEINYTILMSQHHTHLLEVEMQLRWRERASSTLDVVMPVWTPGSYLVREYARHVQDFAAEDGAGRALGWRKSAKNTWRIDAGSTREFRLRYRVYSNELTVRTNEFNDRHAFWNNAALLMYPEGHLKAPSRVRVVPREGWKIATGLPKASGDNTFQAENFDILYDSPFLVSDFKTISFQVRGVPHRIVIDGEGNYDAEKLRRDVQKTVETAVEMMREIPYKDYTFMLMLHPTGSGGLEHLNSTALIWRRFGFQPATTWRDFLGLVAHEYFHLWNVKRIRPDALGAFDYTRENHTRLLWVAEGLTSYYENLLVRRADLMNDKAYLELVARAFQALQNTPGRLEMSVEEASFDAWIKYYRPDENSINSSVSYYDKGAIVGLLLDLEIRKHSNGARSLDDVMRGLYDEFYKKNRNYTPEDFQRASEAAAGSSLEAFFSRYVRGRDELDYNAALAVAGLRLDTTGADDTGKPAPDEAFFGATVVQDGERVLVRIVPAGTPAYDQGLYASDQIVAVDGARATRDFLIARIREKKPGDTIALSVFRTDELRTINIKLGARPDVTYKILPVAQPTEEQARTYRAWLGAPHPRAK
jgi:predicted metalloprotease with PDZ domain